MRHTNPTPRRDAEASREAVRRGDGRFGFQVRPESSDVVLEDLRSRDALGLETVSPVPGDRSDSERWADLSARAERLGTLQEQPMSALDRTTYARLAEVIDDARARGDVKDLDLPKCPTCKRPWGTGKTGARGCRSCTNGTYDEPLPLSHLLRRHQEKIL